MEHSHHHRDDRLHHDGAKFKAIFSSGIGHWDVQNALGVLHETYAMREDDVLTDDDFADSTFAHSVRLHGGMNPNFFKDTLVEDAANKVLAADKKAK